MSQAAPFFDQDVVTARDAPAFASAHARLQVEDAARSRWLSVVVRLGGRCQACRRKLNDQSVEEHPGVCARCFSRGRAKPIRLVLEVLR